MKKRALSLSISIMFLILILPFAFAEENVTDPLDKAYDCLKNKVEDKTCSGLSLEESIFSSLAIGGCSDEILEDSDNEGKCFPKGDCKIKTTAQAILALGKANVDTAKAEEWLLSQNTTPPKIEWFLQIDSSESGYLTCGITYSSSNQEVIFNEDKTISSVESGKCFSKSEGNYWLKVSPECYNNDFEISCDKGFLTSLLFKKEGSSTIHVLGKTNSASGGEGATTTEKINSLCFFQGNTCDYEGSLWAALVLDFEGYSSEVSPYIPYLITMAEEDGEGYLPESFLYYLTGEFKTDLLLKQINSYWSESGDKFYDTAVALYPFSYETPIEKTNSMNWLLEEDTQDTEGCWDKGNIRNTAFLLYSLWGGRGASVIVGDNGDDDNEVDCEKAGYFCMSGASCEGDIKEGYSCSGVSRCCDTPIVEETCEEKNGEVCSSGEICAGGITEDTTGLNYGETCCIQGDCEEPAQQPAESECESSGGICKSSGCNTGEEESFDSCDFSSESCCIEKVIKEKKNYFGIWILFFLIVLIVLGIIFRDRLRPYWFRIKSKFGKSKSGGPNFGKGPRPGFPPAFSRTPPRRIIPRKIFPPAGNNRMPQRRISPPKKPQGELDDVLKKLKEMGS